MTKKTIAAPREAKPAGQQRSIQSIEIGFGLISVLERAEGALALKELALRAGMTASKAHFYLVSFKRVGLVAQSEVTGLYSLGRYALSLGLSALRRLDLVEISREAMRALSEEINESVFLSVWGNRGPTFVFKVDGPRRISRSAAVTCHASMPRSSARVIVTSFAMSAQPTEHMSTDRESPNTRSRTATVSAWVEAMP